MKKSKEKKDRIKLSPFIRKMKRPTYTIHISKEEKKEPKNFFKSGLISEREKFLYG